MSNYWRAAIVVAITLLLGAYTYATSTEVVPSGATYDIVNNGAFAGAILALAVLGVFAVNRWWALLPAIVPALVIAYDRNLTHHDIVLREDVFQIASYNPILFTMAIITTIGFVALLLSLGLLLRLAWNRGMEYRAQHS